MIVNSDDIMKMDPYDPLSEPLKPFLVREEAQAVQSLRMSYIIPEPQLFWTRQV